MWRSLVACLNGVQEAGGSNPLTQTMKNALYLDGYEAFLHPENVGLPFKMPLRGIIGLLSGLE